MSTKYTQLNLGIERAERIRIERGSDIQLRLATIALAQELESTLQPFFAEALVIKDDPNNSEVGRKTKIEDLKARASKAIASIDPTHSLESSVESANANIINKTVQAKDRFKPRDTLENILETLKASQIIAQLDRLYTEAKAQHEQRIANTEGLSDQEKVFHDPRPALYFSICANYDTNNQDHAIFLRAVENAFPKPLFDNEVIDQGTALLQRKVAGDYIEAKEAALTRLAMTDSVIRQALDMAANPLKHAAIQGQYVPLSDREMLAIEREMHSQQGATA